MYVKPDIGMMKVLRMFFNTLTCTLCMRTPLVTTFFSQEIIAVTPATHIPKSRTSLGAFIIEPAYSIVTAIFTEIATVTREFTELPGVSGILTVHKGHKQPRKGQPKH